MISLFLLILAANISLGSELGGYAGASFRVPADALSAGTGGITLFKDASRLSALYNPASLAEATGRQANASTAQLPLDRSIYSALATVPMPPTARLAIGIVSAGTNNIDARDNRGFKAGELTDRETMFLVAFNNQFSNRLSIGLSLKVMSRRMKADEDWLDIKGSGFGANIGVHYTLNESFRLALALQNLNAAYNWKTQDVFAQGSTYRESFPPYLSYGVSTDLGPLRLLLEHDYYFIGENLFHAAVLLDGLDNLTLRSGLEFDGEHLLPGASASYRLIWPGPVMDIDLGMVLGIPGEGVRTYLGWGIQF